MPVRPWWRWEQGVGDSKDWLEHWIKAQQDYWSAWTGPAGAAPGAAADAGRALFDRLMAASRDYFALGQHGLGGNPADLEAWLAGLGQLWSDPARMQSWFQPWMQPFLAMPPLGPGRETQARLQELARCQMEYLAALQAYQAAFAELAGATTRALGQALMERSGKPVASLRGLYDLWVATAETAYGEWAMTPAYQALHGRLVNALMALKRLQGELADQTLAALSLPTRSDLDSLARRQQELSRENRALRARLDALEQAAQATPAPKPPAKPPRRRAAAKKPD